jgi:hypothetical protein
MQKQEMVSKGLIGFYSMTPFSHGDPSVPFAHAHFIRDDSGTGWYSAAYLMSELKQIRCHAAKQIIFNRPKSNPT